MSQIHCFSPRTRRSITGRRSIKLPAVESDDDEILFTDDEKIDEKTDENSNEKSNENTLPLYSSTEIKSNEVTKEIDVSHDNGTDQRDNSKRNRSIAPNDSTTIRTPNPKRFSINGSNRSLLHSTPSKSSHDIEFTDGSNASKSISIESSHSDYEMESVENNNDSIVLLNSSDEENTKPMANSTAVNFKVQTPGVKFVQPKLSFSGKSNKKFVSRAFYQQKEDALIKLRQELNECEALYDRLGHTLPDKGVNLQNRIKDLHRNIKQKKGELDSFAIEEDHLDEVQIVEPTSSTQSKKPLQNWRDELETITPRFTGQQGLSTFNQQKTLTLNRIERLHTAMQKRPNETELARQPDHLNVQLMPHQLHAIKWMRWREMQRPKGGLLADDMGLGKTLTVIGLVLEAKYGKGDSLAEENAEEHSDTEDESDDEIDRGYNKSIKNQGNFAFECLKSRV